MSYTASKLIEIAEAEIGYLEKETNASLDSKTGNAGDENFTKYARDLHAAGYYQANKNGYEWCEMFNDWCHWNASGKNAKLAQEIICQTGLYGAGCVWSAKCYRNAGRWYKSPKVGDQIYFGNGVGKEYHTGIVYKVDSRKVYTIEGNTSGASGVIANGGGVCKKSYNLGYSKIVGYGRPKYDAEPIKKPAAKSTLEVDGQWGKDTTRASQKVLGTAVDGIVSNQPASCRKYVPAALASSWEFKDNGYYVGSALIRAIQKIVGATQDGLCGKNTVKAMQKFLKTKGLYKGLVDGYMGKNTVKAWQNYIISRI